jgi:hypothetical protein
MLKHIDGSKMRFVMEKKDPRYLNSNMAEERARDLADYAALMLEWNEYYDNLLMIGTTPTKYQGYRMRQKRWGLSTAETEYSRDN